jgi:PAS domain S-box-containing protein
MKSTVKLIADRFINRTITRDLTLGLVLIVTVMIVAIGGLNYLVNTTQSENSLKLQAEETADKLANILSVPLWNLDLQTIKNIAEAYQQAEKVVGIKIQDDTDRVIYASSAREDHLITTGKRVYFQERQIGYVEISLSTSSIRSAQRNILVTTAITLLLVTLALLLSTGFLLEISLNRPLRALTLGIDKVASGNYAHILEHAPQTDIDEIVQRVNAMAGLIAERIEALRRERDVIGRIMQTSPVGITMLNQDGQTIFTNSQARKILGLVMDQKTQRSYGARDWQLPDLTENLFPDQKSLFLQVISSAQPIYNVQHSIQLSNRKQILLSINAAPLFNETGQVDGMVAAIENVTERKEAEAELHQRLAELEAVQRISTVLRTAKTLEEMLPRLLDETLAVLDTQAGSILLFNPAEKVLRVVVARGWFENLTDGTIKPGEGIAGRAFETGKPYVSPEFVLDPLTREAARSQIPKGWSGVCLPIRSVDETLGVLFIAVAQPRQLQPENVHLLTTLAEIAGNAFHRTRLHTQTEQRLRRLTALRTLDLAISANVDLRLTLNILIDQALAHLGVDAADVLLFDPQTLTLEYAAGRGFRTDSLTPTRLSLGQGLAGRAALERQIIKIQDWQTDSGFVELPSLAAKLQAEDFVSYYGVPLIVKEQVKGVLELFHRAPLIADPEWLDFLGTLAGQAAIAIDDTQLFSSLQRSNTELALAYDTTLEGWSRALDLRDKETEGHTQRVTTMAIHLAQILNLSQDEIVHLRRGALLHDIGKMGIPDGILLKPGLLTDQEWLIMRRHPTYAYEMLSPIGYLRSSIEIPYCHHEKWDGTGYPQGLKGKGIPLAARIFAIVDVWDALTADRPYRLAWSSERALEYIQDQSGKHFDPEVVAAFLMMMQSR